MPSSSKRACAQPNGCRRERQRIARLSFPRGLLLVVGLSLGACIPQAPAPPAYLLEPADPDRPVPSLVYRDVTAGTRTFRPVDPKGWEQQNKAAGENGMGGMGDMPGMDHSQMKGMGGPAKDNEDGGKGAGAMDDMKGMGGK